MNLHWKYNEKTLNLPLSKQIIENRNCDEVCFLDKLSDYADINLLKNLNKAASKIIDYLKNDKKIMIFGHDDPDGVTAAYILYDFFIKHNYTNIQYYIPNRKVEAHGIQDTFIEKCVKEKIDLVITVDNGIASYEGIKKLKDKNIEVIITDHHLIPEKLPPAYTIINPKLSESLYPDRYLAGVGVSYILMLKLAELLQVDYSPNYLFHTAVGTYSDRVQLRNANRIIIRETFKNWTSFDCEILTLIDKNYKNYSKPYQMQNLLEFFIPIIHNGRDTAGEHQALKMFISNSEIKNEIYQKLLKEKISYGKRREKIDEFIASLPIPKDPYYIYIDKNDEVPYDFAGYFAGAIAEKYFIPVLILKKNNEHWGCEARATRGFNLIDSFKYAKEYIYQFGGHAQAAGFTIYEKNITHFIEKFKEYINKNLEIIEKNKFIEIDAVADCNNIAILTFLSENLDKLYPFGQNFDYPVVLLKNFIYSTSNLQNFILNGFDKLDKNSIYDIVVSIQKNILILRDFKSIKK